MQLFPECTDTSLGYGRTGRQGRGAGRFGRNGRVGSESALRECVFPVGGRDRFFDFPEQIRSYPLNSGHSCIEVPGPEGDRGRGGVGGEGP